MVWIEPFLGHGWRPWTKVFLRRELRRRTPDTITNDMKRVEIVQRGLGWPSIIVLLIFFLSPSMGHSRGEEQAFKSLRPMIGKNDSILVEDASGARLLSINADKKRTPASILKIFTSLMAFHYLGEDYRFPTRFYMDRQRNLIVKGFGDPQLVSESLMEIAAALKAQKKFPSPPLRNIVMDDTFFKRPLVIPGIEKGNRNPYNSPNGAIAVNFNTVYFKKNQGRYRSAEPQTPLLPFVIDRIKASPFSQERIILSSETHENALYAGHLLKYFLEKEAVSLEGEIRTGAVDPKEATLIYTWQSPYTLRESVRKLLYYSNNFMTNQLLIAAGAKAYGGPGDLEKGLRAARDFAKNHLKLTHFDIAEGSGISRKNQVTPATMMKILRAFYPYRSLLKTDGCEAFKTGTLNGVSTRTGFITRPHGDDIAFVIMMNSQGKSAEAVVKILKVW